MITVGLKTKNNIYIAAASQGFTLPSAGYKKDNFPVYVPKSHPDLLVGFTGSILESNIFRYRRSPIDAIKGDFELTASVVINDIAIPFVKSLYDEKLINQGDKFDTWPCTILLAKGDKLFTVNQGLCVDEIDDFAAMDDGDFVAKAILDGISKENEPIYRILKAMTITLEVKRAGGYPIVIKNTQNPSKTLIFDKDKAIKYIKNYERKVGVK